MKILEDFYLVVSIFIDVVILADLSENSKRCPSERNDCEWLGLQNPLNLFYKHVRSFPATLTRLMSLLPV